MCACRRSFSRRTNIFSFIATSYLCLSSSIVGSYCMAVCNPHNLLLATAAVKLHCICQSTTASKVPAPDVCCSCCGSAQSSLHSSLPLLCLFCALRCQIYSMLMPSPGYRFHCHSLALNSKTSNWALLVKRSPGVTGHQGEWMHAVLRIASI